MSPGRRGATYVTDGIHLYRILATNRNYGLAGGGISIVEDCQAGTIREMSDLEGRLCQPVYGEMLDA